MVKPFAFAELLARVRALVRRGRGDRLLRFSVADLVVDVPSRRVTRGAADVDLTPREYELLEYRFGVFNPDVPEGDPAQGAPFPGTLVTDAGGVVRTKFFEKSYAERRTAASFLVLEGEAPATAAGEVRTDHFLLRLSQSNATAAAATA
jgi:hypothetical protein